LYVEAEDLKAVTSSPVEKSDAKPAQATHTWKSANGKFTVAATLESVDGGEAKLVTQDGRHISVAIEKLSADDQKYIKESKEAENPFKVDKSADQQSQ
jgi:hypothetical protein